MRTDYRFRSTIQLRVLCHEQTMFGDKVYTGVPVLCTCRGWAAQCHGQSETRSDAHHCYDSGVSRRKFGSQFKLHACTTARPEDKRAKYIYCPDTVQCPDCGYCQTTGVAIRSFVLHPPLRTHVKYSPPSLSVPVRPRTCDGRVRQDIATPDTRVFEKEVEDSESKSPSSRTPCEEYACATGPQFDDDECYCTIRGACRS